MTKEKVDNKRRREFTDWAHEHGLIISPGKGYEYYLEGHRMFGHCPCDKTRLECPCPESIQDVKDTGHCLCRMYWRDHKTYAEMCLPL